MAQQAVPPRPQPVAPVAATAQPQPPTKLVEIYPQRASAAGAPSARAAVPSSRGDITLNFENADIRIVIETVLDDLLKMNYIIDPDVTGNVTVRTARPVNRAALLATLQAVLSANGAALFRVGDIYRVARTQTAATAAAGPASGPTDTAGYGLSVLPLAFIAAGEMQKILQPVLPANALVVVDEARNLLMVRGTPQERQTAADTVAVFDVDQLAGTAVLLESLERVAVATVVEELENIFGSTKGGPLSGVVRFIPIERMNAILVLTQQPRYLDEVRNWIARLDRSQNLEGRQLFVYYVQNGKAEDLAKTLSSVFSGGRGPVVASVSVAPAATPGGARAANSPGASTAGLTASPVASALRSAGDEGVRIIADQTNNALLILADRGEYGQ
ncbi:MAG: type II secretion system protein GspD, partial [Proteobacteria bacterium]|nr:type II secretion system protein GspD [Pseudomonadota bacterium]